MADDPDALELLQGSVGELSRITLADMAMGGLADGPTVVLSAFRGTRTAVLRGLEIRSGAGLGGRAVASRRPQATEDYLVESRITHQYDPQVSLEGIRSIVAVPIVVDRGVAGLLYAGIRTPVGIGDRTTRGVAQVADRVGRELAIRREVTRRLEQSHDLQRDARHGVGGSELEAVRTAHAELRALTGHVPPGELRRQLEAVSALLAGVVAAPGDPGSPTVRLTGREVDVLAQVALGCTNAEAAHRLDVGPETVKAHLRSASRKLGARSRHEAVVAARRTGALP